MTPAAPWAELADLAARELELARDGRWEELAHCSQERVRRAAALRLPPLEARPALERLAACQEALMAVLASAHALTARELGALHRGGRAARRYVASTAPGGAIAALDDRG
jgi:hypothetical protein